MANTSDVKIFKTRDSATSLLRKLGVKSRDYNLFIEKQIDGGVICKVAAAREHVQSLATPATKVQTKPAASGKIRGISAVARNLISSGRTNKEVWDVLKSEFGLDDKKRGYPAWYRSQMRRAGMLPKEA